MKKLLYTLTLIVFSTSVFAQNTNLKDFVGTFVFEDAPIEKLIITLDNNQLIAEEMMLGTSEITPTNEKDEFGEPNYQALLKFIRNEKGDVVEVEVSAQGMVLYGVKEDTAVDLNQYAGVYNFDDAPFDSIEITVDGDDLIADAEGVGAGEIYATDSKDEFGEPNNQALLKFLKNEAGNVSGLQVSAQGSVWIGKKESSTASSDYVGTYEIPNNEYLSELKIITNDKGALTVITNMGNSDLEPTSETDIFQLKSIDGKLGFDRDSNGKVVGIKIMAMGALFEGVKK